jgi:hypothetical protein
MRFQHVCARSTLDYEAERVESWLGGSAVRVPNRQSRVVRRVQKLGCANDVSGRTMLGIDKSRRGHVSYARETGEVTLVLCNVLWIK